MSQSSDLNKNLQYPTKPTEIKGESHPKPEHVQPPVVAPPTPPAPIVVPPKPHVTPEEVEALKSKLQEIQARFDAENKAKAEAKAKIDEEKKKLEEHNRKIEEERLRKVAEEINKKQETQKHDVSVLGFRVTSPYYLVPAMGYIDVKLPSAREAVRVRPLSMAWLAMFDAFCAEKYPEVFVRKFMDDTAIAVQNALNIGCYEIGPGGKRFNRIVELTMIWPDSNKESNRIRNNITTFIKDIKANTPTPNPTRPGNIIQLQTGQTTEVCPPAPLDLKVTVKDRSLPPFRDVLRKFTAYIQTYENNKLVYECVPDNIYDAIPKEYMSTLGDIYALIPLLNIPADTFMKYINSFLSLNGELKISDEKLNELKKYIKSNKEDGLHIHDQFGIDNVKITYAVKDITSPENQDTERQSLREWYIQQVRRVDTLTYYPLLSVILDVPVPRNTMLFRDYAGVSKFLYKKNQRGDQRLMASAPLEFFRELMAFKYDGIKSKDEPEQDCINRFAENVLNAVRATGVREFSNADPLAHMYRELIIDFYTMDATVGCIEANTPPLMALRKLTLKTTAEKLNKRDRDADFDTLVGNILNSNPESILTAQ